jgi:predicted site-specific integrase-resolvase
MNNEYVSAKRITTKYDISSGTLRRWADESRIKCIRPNTINGQRGGKRLYYVPDIQKMFNDNKPIQESRVTICYARVSSNHQKGDLERQIKVLAEEYPEAKIIKDIGSGINWKRQGFRALLEQIHSGTVKKVVVTYKDRMCRFGFELLEWIFTKYNVEFVVLNKAYEVQDMARELSDDLLAITTVFVAKHNGLRSANYRKNKKLQEQAQSRKEHQDSGLSKQSTETNIETMVGSSEMDI